jgi:hypothetical protein
LSEFIPTYVAWDRVAKMLFPDEPVRAITERDAWLISRYRLPTLPYHGYDIEDEHKLAAPNELIAEVDRAYFRLSLQQRVSQWFAERGFDLSQPGVPKKAFNAVFVRRSAERAKVQLKAITKYVNDYFDGTSHPTMTDAENKYSQKSGSSAREQLRDTYRVEAKKRGIAVIVGRPKKSAK